MSVSISVVAPASYTDPQTITDAAAALASLGIQVQVPTTLQSPTRYLAGSVAHRLESLYAAYEAPDTQAVWAVRGGYGCAQLVEHIDWSRLSSGKPLIGYSDISVLLDQCYRHDVPSIHAPVMKEAALLNASAEQRSVVQHQTEELAALLRGNASSAFPIARHGNDEGDTGPAIQGPVVGGNLMTLACVAGTPARFVAPSGALVILEDVGEPYYRLERALWQLVHAGAFDNAGAICLGSFEGCTPYGDIPLEAIFAEVLKPLDLPLFHGLPVGHGLHNRPWRYGGIGRILEGRLALNG